MTFLKMLTGNGKYLQIKGDQGALGTNGRGLRSHCALAITQLMEAESQAEKMLLTGSFEISVHMESFR
jgi:hypothetical protein